jgi:NAD(P)-dependent dehydrogenase (short-subunit alcohol dehydrogenase family)
MKTAIVTGASGNLGRAIIQTLLARDYYVVALVPPNDPNPLELRQEYLNILEADLMNEQETSLLIESIIASRKSIDVAVLTVGGFAMGNIESTSTAAIIRQVELNFSTAYNIARPLFTHMRQQDSGRIFFVGARPGLSGREGNGMVAYSLGKSLVFRLAELMNEEARGTQVVTHVIVPSTLDTPQNRKAMPDANYKAWVKPADIAEIIHFHCGEASAAIRDSIIKIYGNS